MGVKFLWPCGERFRNRQGCSESHVGTHACLEQAFPCPQEDMELTYRVTNDHCLMG